jgi:hypothetical protein
MVDKVIASALPSRIREQARILRALLPDEAARVERRLEAMAAAEAAVAVYQVPLDDLYRCVPVATVQRHMTTDAWANTDSRAFLAAAEQTGDPAMFVRNCIPDGKIVFLRERSWLIAAESVVDMNSRELKVNLELAENQHPPFILFRLTPERMRAAGVGIRPPTALDAAVGGRVQWNPAGLRIGPEYLDTAVPIEAVEDLLWKP